MHRQPLTHPSPANQTLPRRHGPTPRHHSTQHFTPELVASRGLLTGFDLPPLHRRRSSLPRRTTAIRFAYEWRFHPLSLAWSGDAFCRHDPRTFKTFSSSPPPESSIGPPTTSPVDAPQSPLSLPFRPLPTIVTDEVEIVGQSLNYDVGLVDLGFCLITQWRRYEMP